MGRRVRAGLTPTGACFLVDGEDLLALLAELDAWDPVAEYVDGVGRRDAVDHDHAHGDVGSEAVGVLERVRSWFS